MKRTRSVITKNPSDFRKKQKRTEPWCGCEESERLIDKRTSHSERNNNRDYYSCERCNGFLWCDQADEKNYKLWVKPQTNNQQSPSFDLKSIEDRLDNIEEVLIKLEDLLMSSTIT